jgi:LysM repeat protein
VRIPESMPGRHTAFAAAALAVLALAPAASARSNPQLAGLQVALRAYGLYCGPIDGIAGPATKQAVESLQRRAHLTVDGIAGPSTRAALGPLGRPLFGTRQLRGGAFGWDVAVLQFLLHERGLYRGPYDGYFGAATARALRAYQRSMHLAADGVAGRRTTAALVAELRVPVRPKPVAAATVTVYVVRPGDNLTQLAGRFGTTLVSLAHLNGIDPAKPLLIGTRLRLPTVHASSTPPPAASTAPAAASAQEIRAELGVWAARYGVNPSLARALSWMESGFQPDVVSSVGAWGPMQLLPSTWVYVERSLLGATVPKTAAGNVQVGMAYLKHLLDAFGGDERLALGGWYEGERAVREHGLYPETKVFVDNVLALKLRM